MRSPKTHTSTRQLVARFVMALAIVLLTAVMSQVAPAQQFNNRPNRDASGVFAQKLPPSNPRTVVPARLNDLLTTEFINPDVAALLAVFEDEATAAQLVISEELEIGDGSSLFKSVSFIAVAPDSDAVADGLLLHRRDVIVGATAMRPSLPFAIADTVLERSGDQLVLRITIEFQPAIKLIPAARGLGGLVIDHSITATIDDHDAFLQAVRQVDFQAGRGDITALAGLISMSDATTRLSIPSGDRVTFVPGEMTLPEALATLNVGVFCGLGQCFLECITGCFPQTQDEAICVLAGFLGCSRICLGPGGFVCGICLDLVLDFCVGCNGPLDVLECMFDCILMIDEIPDCNFNCAPLAWVGDGFCDEGGRSYNGVPIYLDCGLWGLDLGDCGPYLTCGFLNPQSCCDSTFNFLPGCNTSDCCNAVCPFDPYCCFIQWDSICADQAGVVCEICPGCGNLFVGDCCEANGTPYCVDETCCDAVCNADSFCCDNTWDSICANAAAQVCECPTKPPNDDCLNAIALSIPSTTMGTTIDANSDEPPAFTCGTSISAPGVWYSVIGTGNTITATTCTDFFDYDTKINVYSGNCSGLICVDGNDDDCADGADGLLSTVPWSSQNGVQYLILVQGFGGQTGDFELVLSGPQPPNDDCADAMPLSIPSTTMGTTTNAKPDEPPAFTCGTSISAPGVWYSVIGTGNTITATTCTDFFDYDTKINVYSGNCSGLICVDGNDDDCDDGAHIWLSTVSWSSQNGVQYLILVQGYLGETGDFKLVLSGPQPPNDDCGDAIALSIPSTTMGTTTNAKTDDPPAFHCGTSIAAPGVWYSVIGTGDTITATTCTDFYDYDTKINVYSGNCSGLSCVDGNDDDCGGGADSLLSTVVWESQNGVQYLILVQGFNGQTGDFELVLSEKECQSNVDCDDGNLCTVDECVRGLCQNTPIICPPGRICQDGLCVAVCPGDVNLDGICNSIDLTLLLSCFGQPVKQCPFPFADVNGDEVVNSIDLTLLLGHFGQVCP